MTTANPGVMPWSRCSRATWPAIRPRRFSANTLPSMIFAVMGASISDRRAYLNPGRFERLAHGSSDHHSLRIVAVNADRARADLEHRPIHRDDLARGREAHAALGDFARIMQHRTR